MSQPSSRRVTALPDRSGLEGSQITSRWRAQLESVNESLLQAEEEHRQLRRTLAQRSAELLRARSELRALAEAFPDLLVRLDERGIVAECRAGDVAGPYAAMTAMIGRQLHELADSSISAALEEATTRARASGSMISVECTVAAEDGTRIAEVRVLPLANDQQLAIVRDITERRRAEEALRESEARKCAILGSALDAIMDLDNEGCVTEMNPAAERLLGCTAEELTGRSLADLVFPAATREVHRAELAHYFATGSGPMLNSRLETIAQRADGTELPIELAIAHIQLKGRFGFTAFLRDLTERKQVEQELTRLAFHDTLTGLPNRALFSDRLQQAVSRAERHAGAW